MILWTNYLMYKYKQMVQSYNVHKVEFLHILVFFSPFAAHYLFLVTVKPRHEFLNQIKNII